MRTLSSILAVVLLVVAHAPAQFTMRPGWPVTVPGASPDGGLLVDMDGDPELEYVRAVGTQGYAFDPDATLVPGWPQTIGWGTFTALAFGDIDGDGEGEIVVNAFWYGVNGSMWAFERTGAVVPGFPVTPAGH